jgi:membrane fusion protein, multidrug efflux system
VTVDLTTGSVTLRALMPNPERLLLPGMFVREQIQEGVRQGAVLAPQQGISHDQKGDPDALVVGADNTVELRTLQTDRAIGDQWVVASGLTAGDRVIVEGIQFAKPGAKVAPEEYRPQAEKTMRQATAAPAQSAD